jgi:hypothetical protein
MNIKIDSSGQNPPLPNYKIVKSDVDFILLAEFDGDLWVSGKELSRWAIGFYRARGIPYQIVNSPKERLRRILGHQVDELHDELINGLLSSVDYVLENKTLDDVICAYTNRQIWYRSPSGKMLASWLIEKIDASLSPVIESWGNQKADACEDEFLASCFLIDLDKRLDLFWDWIENTQSEIYHQLGPYPIRLPSRIATLYKGRFAKKLRSTNGQIVDQQIFKGINAKIEADVCYEYFRLNAENLTRSRYSKIASFLKESQRAALKERVRVSNPHTVSCDSSEKEVLNWACESYLPFRRWQTQFGNELDRKLAIDASTSFENWILKHYPDFINWDRDKSPLNINYPSTIFELCKSRRVFWVMVDGLSWLNYRRLIDKLAGSEAEFGLESDEQTLAILPTITKYAKWSAISGKLPDEDETRSWNIRKAFNDNFPDGRYVGSDDIGGLRDGLSEINLPVIFWNHTGLDSSLHKQTDRSGFMTAAETALDYLAKTISDLVLDAPQNENIAIVISTDHGQCLGSVQTLDAVWEEDPLEIHGRIALGGKIKQESLTDSTVALNGISYRTPEKITIALGNNHFGGSWRTDANGQAWGVHGGLSPEECVLGQGIISRNSKYKEVEVTVQGEGEAGKTGELRLLIDNPNSFSLNDFMLYSDAIEDMTYGQSVTGEVGGLDQRELKVSIASWPAPTKSDSLEFTGKLMFSYADGRSGQSDVQGTLVCKSLYQRKGLSLRNRLRK